MRSSPTRRKKCIRETRVAALAFLLFALLSCDAVEYPYYLRYKSQVRAHFSGDMISGKDDSDFTKLWVEDVFSEILYEGQYPLLSAVCPKATASTFDAVAFDYGTKVIVYSQPDFEGDILLDRSGPLILFNFIWSSDNRYNFLPNEDWDAEMQTIFPPESRSWSETDMHAWSNGSMIIEAD